MQGFDPLVSNGILYSPVHDIVMSDEPVYFANPLEGNSTPRGVQPRDSFVPQNKKTGSWKKWLLGATAVALTIMGIKKFGMKPIRNFLEKHPSVKNCLNSIKKYIPFIKKT